MEDIILSLYNIVKTYPGVVALDDISLDFRRGEIHGLVGENGAGKSTLIKVIAGAIAADSGYFQINGERFERITPKAAKEHGIEVIYQELNLVPSVTVAENVFLGAFPGNGVSIDMEEMVRRSSELFQEMGIEIDPRSKVQELSVAKKQMVEIAKSLVRDVKLLVMDEPTSPLTLYETELLFKLVAKLKAKGVTIIYISHRMNELYQLTDRMTVIRDGTKIKTVNTNEISQDELIHMMVGRELKSIYVEKNCQIGEPILEVQNFSGGGFRNISFTLRKGEILGFAGLVGAGRTELMRGIFGADPIAEGNLILEGKPIQIHSPEDAVRYGIGFLPEDRKLEGVLLELPIRDNITLSILKRISRFGVVDTKREEEILNKHKDDLRIKAPSMMQLVKNLSGGNQQKVAISKWLASDCKILIFDEPTRGIDVGAKHEIYQLLADLASAGISIIVVSSEMEEILGIADRILVLYEGTMTGEIKDKKDFSQDLVMKYAISG